jgi:hypothetical protein
MRDGDNNNNNNTNIATIIIIIGRIKRTDKKNKWPTELADGRHTRIGR